MAVTIQPWLRSDHVGGTILAGESVTMDISLDPGVLAEGIYSGLVYFTASDLAGDIAPVELPVQLTVTDGVGIDNEIESSLPVALSLDQNYPNPFNARTEIKYALPVDSDVKLEVFNVLGQKITTLVDDRQTAGYYNLIWDGTNESGQVVSSGIYMYKLIAGDNALIKKMLLLK
jgi:hypothetical protein